MTPAVHRAAAVGFDAGADAYERGRPGFPPEAVDRLVRELGIEPGRTVLDLAAGTGKLTRMLAPFGPRLFAVEPVEGMRRAFKGLLPDVPVAAEEREGAFEGFPSSRDTRRQAILSMNRDGIPHAIRETIDDPPVRDPEPITRVPAPSLVIGQHGDPVHTAEVAKELADALPHSELMLFDDRFAMLREIPALVQRIASFLSG